MEVLLACRFLGGVALITSFHVMSRADSNQIMLRIWGARTHISGFTLEIRKRPTMSLATELDALGNTQSGN
jgi:hypothetical protein